MRRLMHVSIISSRWVVSTLALLGSLFGGSLPATSQAAQAPPSVSTGFQLGITHEPNVVLTSDAMVYAVSDPAVAYTGDLFRYGQYWFAHEGDHWYRSLGWDGEFKPIETSRVPRAVIVVPKRFWKGYRGADAMAPMASRQTAAMAVPAPAKNHPVTARSATSGGTIRAASAQPRIVAVSHPVAASSPSSHSKSASHVVAASMTHTAQKTASSKKASPKSDRPVPASSATVAKASLKTPKHDASATAHDRTTKSSEGPVASKATVPVKLDAKAEKKVEHEQDKLMKERLKEARKEAEQAEKLAHAKSGANRNSPAKSGEPDSGSIAKAAPKHTGATVTRSAKPAAKPVVTTSPKTAAKTSKAASSKKADENLTASR